MNVGKDFKEERKEKIDALRQEGYTYEQIGEVVKLSLQRVWQIVNEGTEKYKSALTPREKEVLTLASEGNNWNQIGEKLSIKKTTVSIHKRNIFKKFDCSTIAHAVAIALKKGLI